MVLVEPTITVWLNVAVPWVPLTVSFRPPGVVWKVSATVRGSSRTDLVSVRPPESRTVSWSSRYDGYSWSGAVKLPDLTPWKLWSWCWWQLDGQWLRTRFQVNADAGSGPSCASVAEPEKLMTSPTFQVVPA